MQTLITSLSPPGCTTPPATSKFPIAKGSLMRALLVAHKLLTPYQADRIAAGTTYGLVLGNYRVLDRLGAGGMAVVFKGEHLEMRRTVAIKVLPLTADQHSKLLPRFIAEMRTVAQ